MSTQHAAASSGRTIVVIGGGIAGLLTAAACAPHADRVVVVERDALPDRPGPRPGTPQALHAHGLLASGRLAMESLVPGLTAELVAAGAISRGDIGSNARWWIGGGLIADCELGVTGVAVSRALLEAMLRQRVRLMANVEIRDATEVTGLASMTRQHRVTGVWVSRRRTEGPGAEACLLAADLVVDASGRASQAAAWFEMQGWPVPREDRITVGVRYATTHIAAEPDDLEGRVVCVRRRRRPPPGPARPSGRRTAPGSWRSAGTATTGRPSTSTDIENSLARSSLPTSPSSSTVANSSRAHARTAFPT